MSNDTFRPCYRPLNEDGSLSIPITAPGGLPILIYIPPSDSPPSSSPSPSPPSPSPPSPSPPSSPSSPPSLPLRSQIPTVSLSRTLPSAMSSVAGTSSSQELSIAGGRRGLMAEEVSTSRMIDDEDATGDEDESASDNVEGEADESCEDNDESIEDDDSDDSDDDDYDDDYYYGKKFDEIKAVIGDLGAKQTDLYDYLSIPFKVINESCDKEIELDNYSDYFVSNAITLDCFAGKKMYEVFTLSLEKVSQIYRELLNHESIEEDKNIINKLELALFYCRKNEDIINYFLKNKEETGVKNILDVEVNKEK